MIGWGIKCILLPLGITYLESSVKVGGPSFSWWFFLLLICSVCVCFARCASCCSSVARGNCACRSGSLPCQTVKRRRSSGKWPPWCCHDNRAPATSFIGKTWRSFTRGEPSLRVLPSGLCLFVHYDPRLLPSPRHKLHFLQLILLHVCKCSTYKITAVLPSLQVCQLVFLPGYREPGKWVVSPGGHSSLRGTAGQILRQCTQISFVFVRSTCGGLRDFHPLVLHLLSGVRAGYHL